MDEWAQFALETPKGSQQLAIENKKPPTDKALSYLSEAKSKVAAAIDYAVSQKTDLASKTVFVYDLGGGTFDATVMRIERLLNIAEYKRRQACRWGAPGYRLGSEHRFGPP